jgi:hypothetical protein
MLFLVIIEARGNGIKTLAVPTSTLAAGRLSMTRYQPGEVAPRPAAGTGSNKVQTTLALSVELDISRPILDTVCL